ncbi:hypothetical protein N0V84_012079 [Fusarium piperis]|uniref:Uncharacterized protein n=1 Tax=Fusarium piperis TaxID=1435070 RepID=A0A9W8W2I7_9HYPO|nr:hypothetical protein N0V84_012079 [Fusarium piperis]
MRYEFALLALAQGILANPCKKKVAVSDESTAFLTPTAAIPTSTSSSSSSSSSSTSTSTSSTPVVVTYTNAAGSTVVTTLSPPSTSTTTTTTTTTTTSNQAAATGGTGGTTGGRRLIQRSNNGGNFVILRQTIDRQFRVPSKSDGKRVNRIEAVPQGGTKIQKITDTAYKYPKNNRIKLVSSDLDDNDNIETKKVASSSSSSDEDHQAYEDRLYDNVNHEVADNLGLTTHRAPRYRSRLGRPLYRKIGVIPAQGVRLRHYHNVKRSDGDRKKDTLVDQAKVSKEQRARLRELYLKYREILATDIVRDLDKVFKITVRQPVVQAEWM